MTKPPSLTLMIADADVLEAGLAYHVARAICDGRPDKRLEQARDLAKSCADKLRQIVAGREVDAQ